MSDEKRAKDAKVGDEDYVAPVPPSGYVPGLPEDELPAGQNVGDRGEVIPPPEEVLEQQAAVVDQQRGGSGGGASPDTAAAGAEHEDR